MAGMVKRMITEEGVVLEKIFKEATNEFKGQDGNIVPAQPDRYILKCVSTGEFDKNIGFKQATVLDYKVDKSTYDSSTVYSPVVVRYELSNYGSKADSVALKTL